MDTSVERLYTRYHLLLVRFLTRMTHCPQRAEDLAQAAWLKLLGARSRGACPGGDESELRAYLFTVARNAFLDEYTRKHAVVRTRTIDPCLLDSLIDESGGSDGPEQDVARGQVYALLQGAVDRLPVEQRKVILMWSQGASIREMASACDAPRDTVLSRKKYAVARLRNTIGGEAQAMA
ncbi:MAG: sigma-70 family RNA polymerase sigma factor [Steroidobacteraceae bacterium]